MPGSHGKRVRRGGSHGVMRVRGQRKIGVPTGLTKSGVGEVRALTRAFTRTGPKADGITAASIIRIAKKYGVDPVRMAEDAEVRGGIVNAIRTQQQGASKKKTLH